MLRICHFNEIDYCSYEDAKKYKFSFQGIIYALLGIHLGHSFIHYKIPNYQIVHEPLRYIHLLTLSADIALE